MARLHATEINVWQKWVRRAADGFRLVVDASLPIFVFLPGWFPDVGVKAI